MWRDFKFALRRLAHAPGFSATVVLLLGLTLGANASVFGVLYGLLYKPLPFAGADRLVVLDTRLTNLAAAFEVGMSVPMLEQAAQHARTLDGVAAWRSSDRELRSADSADAAGTFHAALVQPGVFALLGARPALGRLLAGEDAARGAAKSAMISWNLWQARYGGADVLGKTLALGDGDARIVGVLPRGFAFPHATTQLWLPLQFSDAERGPAQAGSFGDLGVMARLAPQATAAAVDSELAAMARELPGLKEIIDLVGLKINALPLRSLWLGDRRPALELMLLAVALVLLVATANLCNLYIARRLARRHELAVLDALGASPWRRLRETFAETFALGSAGAAAGAALVVPGSALLQRFDLVPDGVPQGVGLDAVTIAFVTALALLLALVMAASASWLLRRRASAPEMRADGPRQTLSRGTQRARHALIVAQIALTAALLVGIGLLLRSSQHLLAENVGFDRDDLALTALADLPKVEPGVAAEPAALASAAAATQAFVERCRALPGVTAAALASVAPFGWSMSVGNFALPGHADDAAQPTANRAYVGADFFRAIGAPLRRGRAFSAEETRSHAAVAIVDETFARQVFGDRDPVGLTFLMGSDGESKMRELSVVGVAPTLKLQALDETAQRPTVFQPDEYPVNAMLLLRTHGDAGAIASAVRTALRETAPQARMRDLVTMRERIAETLRDRTRLNALLELFGAMALTLAAVGLYAVIAYAVRMRTTEFGVRMALGASAGAVLRNVIGHGSRLIAAGLLLALPLALAVERLLGARLYHVGAFDGVTLAGVAALLGAVALFACWLPARRAARVDPIEALRHE